MSSQDIPCRGSPKGPWLLRGNFFRVADNRKSLSPCEPLRGLRRWSLYYQDASWRIRRLTPGTGSITWTTFCGTLAQERATEYADFMNDTRN